jgi:hypothetical protein
VLVKAGVAEEEYRDLGPMNRHKGSADLVTYASHSLLQRARRQIETLQVSFDALDSKRVVWFDARKERSETRPSRLVHRAHEAATELEQAGPTLPRSTRTPAANAS